MSYVIAAPDVIAPAAMDLAAIGSNLSAAHTAAAAPTLGVLPAAADEVSAGIAQFFSRHAQEYQARAGQAAAFQEQFVQRLTASAGSYAAAEASSAALLQPLAANAASFTGAIGAWEGEIANFINNAITTLSQLLNSLAGFLLPLIQEALAFSITFFFVFVLPAINFALNLLVVL